MKKLLSLTAALLMVTSMTAANETIVLRIKGMRCEECGHKVSTAVRKLAGIGKMDFDFEKRTVAVEYDPVQTCADSIRARLAATGRYKSIPYDKNEVIRRGMGLRMDDMHCQNCADRIMKRLETIEGVDSMSPHIDKQYMFIRYDANKTCKKVIREATGDFVAYSWQILGQLALSDLTNTKDLLISLTYGTTGHPFGNTSSPQYANNYEPETDHFSLEEVHGALSLDIQNGLRGYHIASSYVIPADVIAVKVGAGYSASKGAYVNYTDFDGNSATIITPKNSALVLKAAPGVHDFVLSAALNEQTISNGNSMSPGTQAGFNTGTTKNRACFRFVSDATKPGFQRNSDENYTVTLEAKDEVFLMVNTQETNFWGNYAWENDAKDWITWNGGQYIDTGVSPIANRTGYELGASMKSSNSTYFDLQGRRVIKPTKGIYVKNNKKRFLR